MCGVAGWVGVGRFNDLGPMLDSLDHRGPESQGRWGGRAVSMGMTRLAVIDPDGGGQPVFDQGGHLVAVCNGEIYNHVELKRLLAKEGCSIDSNSDVAVIPHLYAIFGEDFVKLLRGMFAIALWDNLKQKLLLARDPLGEKPLYYIHSSQQLVFASEPRAFRACGWHGDPDFKSLQHVLARGYLPTDRGAWEGLRLVPPGSMTIFCQDKLRVDRYYEWLPQDDKLTESAVLPAIDSCLTKAVQSQLVADRPVGVFLSGGIDSTLVCAIASRSVAKKLKTFSIGFADKRLDESGFAREVSVFLGTDHNELIVHPDADELFGLWADAFDQPFADPSALPTLLLSDLTAQQVVVALSGDGGDEAFGGYERYAAAVLLQKGNQAWRVLGSRRDQLESISKTLAWRRLARLAQELRPFPSALARYASLVQAVPFDVCMQLWSDEVQDAFPITSIDILESVSPKYSATGTLPIDAMRTADMSTYLPGDLLMKVDRASMHYSLEVRAPFLDPDVLAVAARMPARSLLRGRTTKWALRQLAYQYVPRELVDRPKKGFSIPQADWLRGPFRNLARDILLGEKARHRGWFNTQGVQRLWDQHEAGTDRSRFLWPVLAIELWAQSWVD